MNYHFIGLGGIGMSALARLLLQQGAKVQGSDIKETELLKKLQREGATFFLGHKKSNLQEGMTVVYSSGILPDNEELIAAKKGNFSLLHRAELLNWLAKGKEPLLVTGTHGKTTTTALLATVLLAAGSDPTYVVGGIVLPQGVNSALGQGKYFVAEADESDGSFLQTKAKGAIVTNFDLDHLDFWKTEEALKEGFSQFFQQTEKAVFCFDDPVLRKIGRGISYGFTPGADGEIVRYAPSVDGISFDVRYREKVFKDLFVPLFGRHNCLNGTAVFLLALAVLQIPEEAIRRGLASFQGTKRRLEKKATLSHIDIYEDYGHHPTEIAATIKAVKERGEGRRVVLFFQPHRYTRVEALFRPFQEALKMADLTIVTDIYGASEAPIPGVTGAKLAEGMGPSICYIGRKELVQEGVSLLRPHDILLFMGAGDIGEVISPMVQAIEEKKPKLRLAILCGGTSTEHRVSIKSAERMLRFANRSIYEIDLHVIPSGGTSLIPLLEEIAKSDLVLPIFHGRQGEDGSFSALFSLMGKPFFGPSMEGGALMMHKGWSKLLAQRCGIATAPWVEVENPSLESVELVRKHLSYPVWVKPIHGGSSIDVTRVAREEDLLSAIEKALQSDEKAIIEEEILGREIEFGFLAGKETAIAEAMSDGTFYDFEKKYGTKAAVAKVPAPLSEEEEALGRSKARALYEAVGSPTTARVDFFLDRQGKYWFLEMNPIPGYTETSAFPRMCLACGITEEEVFDRLVIGGLYGKK